MSLRKQLWVAVFVLLALLLGFSLVIGGLSSKSYIERQLASQNADSARALAPTVARLIADGSPIEPSLQAQFDSGAYELIRYTDPAGRSPISLQDDQPQGNVPAWFAGLIALGYAGFRILSERMNDTTLGGEELRETLEYLAWDLDDELLVFTLDEAGILFQAQSVDVQTEEIIEILSEEDLNFNDLINEN